MWAKVLIFQGAHPIFDVGSLSIIIIEETHLWNRLLVENRSWSFLNNYLPPLFCPLSSYYVMFCMGPVSFIDILMEKLNRTAI